MKEAMDAETLTYTVQEAATQSGLTTHTLRYYERIGLLDPPTRAPGSGHRAYNDADLRRVQFLKRLRTTGMSVREMRRFVALYRIGDSTLGEREKMLADHRCVVLAQIGELQEAVAAIEYKIASFQNIGRQTYWTDKENK